VLGLLPPFIYLFPVFSPGSRANHGDNTMGMADRHLLESADSPIPSNSACCCLHRYSALLSQVEPDPPNRSSASATSTGSSWGITVEQCAPRQSSLARLLLLGDYGDRRSRRHSSGLRVKALVLGCLLVPYSAFKSRPTPAMRDRWRAQSAAEGWKLGALCRPTPKP
jgi:hypothetical protein